MNLHPEWIEWTIPPRCRTVDFYMAIYFPFLKLQNKGTIQYDHLKIYIPTALGLMKLRDLRRSRCYHKLLGENYITYNNRTNFEDSFDLIIELSRR